MVLLITIKGNNMKNLLGLFFAFALILSACTNDATVENTEVSTDSTAVTAPVDSTAVDSVATAPAN
jgi:hypothetical protein